MHTGVSKIGECKKTLGQSWDFQDYVLNICIPNPFFTVYVSCSEDEEESIES